MAERIFDLLEKEQFVCNIYEKVRKRKLNSKKKELFTLLMGSVVLLRKLEFITENCLDVFSFTIIHMIEKDDFLRDMEKLIIEFPKREMLHKHRGNIPELHFKVFDLLCVLAHTLKRSGKISEQERDNFGNGLVRLISL